MKMVNITALQQITNFLNGKNIRHMKKWSNRSRYGEDNNVLLRNVHSMVKKIKRLLIIISGDDVVEMLKSILIIIIMIN